MTRRSLETPIHVAILHYLLAVLPKPAAATLAHVPNGENRDARTGAFLKRLGTRPGMEDLQFIWHGRLHAIEVKREGGRQSPAQRARQDAVVIAGGRYAVCRSIEDARETLREWAIPMRER